MTNKEKTTIENLVSKWLLLGKKINALLSDKVVKDKEQVHAVKATVKIYETCAQELAEVMLK